MINKKLIIKNNNGVAILMVLVSVAILSFILAEYTFDTKLNKLKVWNTQEKAQARLNAESGLQLAMARLKLYKEYYNIIEKNEDLKKKGLNQKLQEIITQPFVYPIPKTKQMNLIQKNAIDEFEKNTQMRGSVRIIISPITGLINPNNLRAGTMAYSFYEKGSGSASSSSTTEDDEDPGNPNKDTTVPGTQSYVLKELTDILTSEFESKKQNDKDFMDRNKDADPQTLIKELAFYVNEQGKYDDPYVTQINARYHDTFTIPKHAPFTDISELNLLLGWNDEIIDMLKDRLSVHENTLIPVNEITKSQLKTIFKGLRDEEAKQFFEYRDGGEPSKDNPEGDTPHPFNTEEDFKAAIIKFGIASEEEYNNRKKMFEDSGVTFGVASKLYKVSVTGSYERANYTIMATVDLPIKPRPITKKSNPGQNPAGQPMDENPSPEPSQEPQATPDKNGSKKTPIELLEPRVIELKIE